MRPAPTLKLQVVARALGGSMVNMDDQIGAATSMGHLLGGSFAASAYVTSLALPGLSDDIGGNNLGGSLERRWVAGPEGWNGPNGFASLYSIDPELARALPPPPRHRLSLPVRWGEEAERAARRLRRSLSREVRNRWTSAEIFAMGRRGNDSRASEEASAPLYEFCAQSGHPRAMAIVGKWLWNGPKLGYASDRQGGQRLLLAAADLGDTIARHWCLIHGVGVKTDPELALAVLAVAASGSGKGDPRVQYALGMAMLEGVGTVVNPVSACCWLDRAASHGLGEALYILGRCRRDGVGVEADVGKWLLLWQRSAGRGHCDALIALGEVLLDGGPLGSEFKDETRARRLWARAADQGSELAADLLEIAPGAVEAAERESPRQQHGTTARAGGMTKRATARQSGLPAPNAMMSRRVRKFLGGEPGRCTRRDCVNVDSSSRDFLVCTGCFEALYCSESCQRRDWSNHHITCAAAADEIRRG